jgi:hypothetical protein
MINNTNYTKLINEAILHTSIYNCLLSISVMFPVTQTSLLLVLNFSCQIFINFLRKQTYVA